MNKSYLIAAMVISIAIGFTMWAFSSSMTPYVDIQTAKLSDGAVQVRGKILHAAAPGVTAPFYDSTVKALRFWIEDEKKNRIEIVYRGAKPDAFDTAPETAAHGVVRKGANGSLVFDSDSLVVKCPSKYEDKSDPYKRKTAGLGGSA